MSSEIIKNRLIFASLVAMLAVFAVAGTSCRVLKRDKQAVAEKKQEDANKKADAEYEKARKQHYANQNKETKKMMKQTKKDASRYNKPRKRKFYWLGVKCR
jgi:type VI protein secretion system component VasK